eukprot:193608-Pelagomonas_calceolata.AAC.2
MDIMRQHLVSVIKDAMSDLRGQLGLMVGGSDYGRQPGLCDCVEKAQAFALKVTWNRGLSRSTMGQQYPEVSPKKGKQCLEYVIMEIDGWDLRSEIIETAQIAETGGMASAFPLSTVPRGT